MQILVLGVNHKTAPLELREKLSVPPNRMPDFLKLIDERPVFREKLLLSTCNRTEIYGVGDEEARAIGAAKEALSRYADLPVKEFEDNLYVLRQPHSVEHLFSVASGLDSMIVGETEITGQVKDAYLLAHQNRQTGKVLNALFQRSLKVAKHLRTETQIGAGRVSVASVAVHLAEKIFGALQGARVMVIGTGDMASQVTRAMVSKGAFPLIVSSHRFDRAQRLQSEFGGEAVHYDQFENHLAEVDILIASTLAPLILIHEPQVRSWMKTRRDKPLFIIDIAMPRNVDKSVGNIDNVYLYNLDDLQDIAGKNLACRQSQIDVCLQTIHRQTQHFMDWLVKESPRP